MEQKIKLLYVDDEPVNLELFKINFRKKYQVFTATDGDKGLEALEKNPDTLIVISDMKMPGMNGIEFIEQANRDFPDKKFYILTGFDITDEIQSALDSGLILEYFHKPLNIKEMRGVLEEAIRFLK